jgi:hypothetical protein
VTFAERFSAGIAWDARLISAMAIIANALAATIIVIDDLLTGVSVVLYCVNEL